MTDPLTAANLTMLQEIGERHNVEHGELHIRAVFKAGILQEARVNSEHRVQVLSMTRVKARAQGKG